MNKKHTFKKVLSAVLTLLMVLSSMTILPLSTSATTTEDWDAREAVARVWDGSTMTPAGAGTEKAPIAIRTGAELQGLVTAINNSTASPVYVKLMNDINMAGLAFTPLAQPSKEIVFDGNNNAIFNLTITNSGSNKRAALFHDFGVGVIQNLTFVDVNVTSVNAQAAALIGALSGVNLTIDNVDVVGGTIKGGTETSAIVAYSSDTKDATWTIRNCDVSATISGATTAGIFGTRQNANKGLTTLIVDNCTTSGAITGTSNTGGMVARFIYGKVLSVTNCENSGTVKTTSGHCGGIIGQSYTDVDTADYSVTVKNCKNTGAVTGTSNVGGIAGEIRGKAANHGKIFVSGCVNTGAVTSTTANTSNSWRDGVGGIMGTLGSASSSSNFVLQSCVNTGNVTSARQNTAGIVGTIFDIYSPILALRGCVNTGSVNATANVDSTAYAGGLAGQIRAQGSAQTLDVDHCYNSGKITVKNTSTGTNATTQSYGLIAWHSGSQITKKSYENCAVYLNGVTNTNYNTKVAETTAAIVTAMANSVQAAIEGMKTLQGSGTQADPYTLANRADLDGFMGIMNYVHGDPTAVYVELLANIDMSGREHTPIYAYNTAVHFDGNNYAIQNMTIGSNNSPVSNAALFQAAGRDSSFQNLRFVNADVYASDNAAALVAHAPALYGFSFVNIAIDNTSAIVSKGSCAGTLIGYSDTVSTAATPLTMQYCVNEAAVTAGTNVGGFLGNVRGSLNYDVDYCVNKGAITATAAKGNCSVGGLIGNSNRGGAKDANENPIVTKVTLTFDNCYNVGTLTGSSGSGVYLWIGGLFGCMRVDPVSGTTETTMTVTNCFDESSRSYSADANETVGGLVGNSDKDQFKLRTFNNCLTRSKDGKYSKMFAATIANIKFTDSNDNNAITDTTSDAYKKLTSGMAAIDAAIAAIKVPTLSLVEGNIARRLSLAEPFGLMTITSVTYNGKVVNCSEYKNTFSAYGFYYYELKAGEKVENITNTYVKNNGVKRAGEAYIEESGSATNRFCSTYTELSASRLSTTICFVSYVVVAGQTYISNVASVNPYEAATSLKDDASIPAAEQLVYEKMIAYYDAYKDYLDSLN